MSDAQTLSDIYSEQLFPNTIIQLIAAAFGIFGNCVVLLFYSKYVADKSGSRFFIPILALVDLVGTVSNSTQFHLDNTMQYTYPGTFLCKSMSFLIVLTGGFSGHLILAIALQRYLIICRPFGHQMSAKNCRIAVLMICLISVGYASPILKYRRISYEFKSSNVTVNASLCKVDDGTKTASAIIPYLGVLLFLSFINIVVTSVLYIPVTKIIYERLSLSKRLPVNNVIDGEIGAVESKETEMSSVKTTDAEELTEINDEPTSTSRKNKSQKEKAKKNITVMFLVIIIVYVVSYLTSLVTHIYEFASKEEMKGYKINVYYLCIRFQLLNHISNPYIYWIFDIKFKNELRRFCRSLFCRK